MPHRKKEIFSIGHSNRPIATFVELLHQSGIQLLADIRRFPNSKRHPQFNKTNLERSLNTHEIGYDWLGEQLGGFRDGDYASYMHSESFRNGLHKLQELAEKQTVAFMCAEKLFSDCHRRFVADSLTDVGWRVQHIVDRGQIYSHNPGLLL